jgi:hypothetical protein
MIFDRRNFGDDDVAKMRRPPGDASSRSWR